MNNYIEVGKIVNTFGIKGELKIKSNFEYKDRIFIKDFPIYIGINKIKELVDTYRVHKNYDMVLFAGYKNINEVLKYKDSIIYIDRNDLKLKNNEYLLADLIGYEVYDQDKLLGVIVNYDYYGNRVLFNVLGEKKFYLPNIPEYIKNIDKKNKRVITEGGSELII